MKSLDLLVWLLPVMFLLHDFEEIILVGVWKQKYRKILNRLSTKKQPYSHFRNTDSFSMAIAVLFLIIVVIGLLSIITKNYIIWYGTFFTFTAHFLVHIVLTLRFKHFVPGIITSIILMPICLLILYQVTALLPYSYVTLVISSLLCCLLLAVIFYFINQLINVFDKWLQKYASNEWED